MDFVHVSCPDCDWQRYIPTEARAIRLDSGKSHIHYVTNNDAPEAEPAPGLRARYRRWASGLQARTWERATPAERAAAYSGWRATFRLKWHRLIGKMGRDQ